MQTLRKILHSTVCNSIPCLHIPKRKVLEYMWGDKREKERFGGKELMGRLKLFSAESQVFLPSRGDLSNVCLETSGERHRGIMGIAWARRGPLQRFALP